MTSLWALVHFDSFNCSIQKPRENFLVFAGCFLHLGLVYKDGKLYVSGEFGPLSGIAC